MTDTIVIPLGDLKIGSSRIKFLTAELLTSYPPRCAWIKLSLDGVEQEIFRLDLYKQVYLDHFYDDTDLEDVLLESAPIILDYIFL